jgi:hypothetical protein
LWECGYGSTIRYHVFSEASLKLNTPKKHLISTRKAAGYLKKGVQAPSYENLLPSSEQSRIQNMTELCTSFQSLLITNYMEQSPWEAKSLG